MRNVGLDLSRGLLMIYIIVVIHGLFYLNLIPRPYSTFLLLEMPLIFLISGYACALSLNKTQKITGAFYREYALSRISRILIPFFAYAFTCALIVALTTESTNYLDIFITWLNPITHGKGFSPLYFRDHLWFIPVFLIVTLIMPLCKFFQIRTALALFLLCMFFAILVHFESILAMPAFYCIWAYLGFKIANGFKLTIKQLLIIAIVSFIFLLVSELFHLESIDMQYNKFPPNYNFLAFSAIWVSFALYVKENVSKQDINLLASNKIIRLFIHSGYSLYLWQGLGYSAAIYIGEMYALNVLIVWIVAVLITVALGVIATPLEKLRWRQTL